MHQHAYVHLGLDTCSQISDARVVSELGRSILLSLLNIMGSSGISRVGLKGGFQKLQM